MWLVLVVSGLVVAVVIMLAVRRFSGETPSGRDELLDVIYGGRSAGLGPVPCNFISPMGAGKTSVNSLLGALVPKMHVEYETHTTHLLCRSLGELLDEACRCPKGLNVVAILEDGGSE